MQTGYPTIYKCSKCGSTNHGYTADMRLLCRNCGHSAGKQKNDWLQEEKKPRIYEHRADTIREF